MASTRNYADLIVEAKKIGIAFTGQKPDELQAQIDARLEAIESGSVAQTPTQEVTNFRHEVQLAVSLGATDSDDSKILQLAQKYASVLPSVTIDQVIQEEFTEKPTPAFVEVPNALGVDPTSTGSIDVPVRMDEDVPPPIIEGAVKILKKAKKPAIDKKPKETTAKQSKEPKVKTTKTSSEERKAKILSLWAEGMSKNKIAKELDIYYSQVDSCIKRWAPTKEEK